jgi:hypothetical protein
MTRRETSVRVRAELFGIIFKSITTFFILLYDSKSDLGLVAFATGQLSYSLAIIAAYLFHFGSTPMFPKWTTSSK